MDSFTPAPSHSAPPAPSYDVLASVTDQIAAIDRLIELAEHRICVFDYDLSQLGWNAPRRIELLAVFLRRSPDARLDIIAHDTRYLETSCPRLMALLRLSSAMMQINRTGREARAASDALVIIDHCHFLRRFHIDQPRAALGLFQPALATPLISRFEEIWATGEPGVGASVLGL